MEKFMRIFSLLLLGLLGASFTQSAMAQTAPLSDKDRAVLYFDIRLDRIQESELAKTLGIQNQMTPQGDLDLSKAVRISGSASAPESVQQFNEMEGVEELPIQFFVRIQYADEESLKEALDSLKEKSTSFTQGGKTYYRPEDNNSPKNICMVQADATTMVMGTDSYVFLADHKAAFTDGLKSSINRLGSAEQSFSIALDLAGAKDLIDEAIEMGKAQSDPMIQPYLDIIPGMRDLRITMDFSGNQLFTLGTECADADAASQVKDALDSIFGLAKMGASAQLGQIKQMQPAMAEPIAVIEKVLRSLSPKLEGNHVGVKVAKPEGFEAAVQKVGEMMGGMMMGGGQGFDEDFGDDDGEN
jgi:hypothetical protein